MFSFNTDFKIEELFGGALLCARHLDFLIFYDWNKGTFITKIDINAKKLYWSENY